MEYTLQYLYDNPNAIPLGAEVTLIYSDSTYRVKYQGIDSGKTINIEHKGKVNRVDARGTALITYPKK